MESYCALTLTGFPRVAEEAVVSDSWQQSEHGRQPGLAVAQHQLALGLLPVAIAEDARHECQQRQDYTERRREDRRCQRHRLTVHEEVSRRD